MDHRVRHRPESVALLAQGVRDSSGAADNTLLARKANQSASFVAGETVTAIKLLRGARNDETA